MDANWHKKLMLSECEMKSRWIGEGASINAQIDGILRFIASKKFRKSVFVAAFVVSDRSGHVTAGN